MRIIHLLALFLLVGVVTSAAVYLLAREVTDFPKGTQSIPYTFSIGENPGVDVGTDIFRLGQVRPGGTSWRALSIAPSVSSATTEEQLKQEYAIVARGAGSEWLFIEPAILPIPGEINITLRAPVTASMGKYEGTLYVVPYER